MEGHALAQRELIRQAIVALTPGFRQAGGYGVARHGLHQGIVQGVEQQKTRALSGFGWVKEGGGQGEVNRMGHLPLRLRTHVSKVSTADDQQSQTHAAEQTPYGSTCGDHSTLSSVLSRFALYARRSYWHPGSYVTSNSRIGKPLVKPGAYLSESYRTSWTCSGGTMPLSKRP